MAIIWRSTWKERKKAMLTPPACQRSPPTVLVPISLALSEANGSLTVRVSRPPTWYRGAIHSLSDFSHARMATLDGTRMPGGMRQGRECMHVNVNPKGASTQRPEGDARLGPQRMASRRDIGIHLGAVIAALTPTPQAVQAAGIPPFFFGAKTDAYPEAIRFPRNRLDQRFAVLLMRSVYEAVSTLGFISMSDFQAKFWKLRQNEYEPYLQRISPLQVKQGDLQDPLYFDFISFAQMATIDREIPSAKRVLEGKKRDEPRSGSATGGEPLPVAIQQLAGDGIFSGLRDGFRDEVFGGPSARQEGARLEQLATDVQLILDIFVAKGYALKASLDDVTARCSEGSCEYHGASGSAGSFRIKLDGPASLWGLGALSKKGSEMNTDFAALAVDAYLRASGVKASYELARTPSSVVQSWTLQ